MSNTNTNTNNDVLSFLVKFVSDGDVYGLKVDKVTNEVVEFNEKDCSKYHHQFNHSDFIYVSELV